MKKEALELYQKLKAEWNSNKKDLNKCGQYLNQIKLMIAEIGFIPTEGVKIDKQDLHLARDVFEIGAHYSILTNDISAFERYIVQLKHFYFDFENELPESPYKYEILGLNLLCLLSKNRLSEFHTELELLKPKIIQSNIYIKHPVSLEQYLMEGSYNKVFLSKGNVPSQNYNYFMEILLNTIRNEIASCMEKAYKRISFNEALNMLNLKKTEDLIHLATERNWILNADKHYYFKQESVIDQESRTIPSNELIFQMLEYAKELEIIV